MTGSKQCDILNDARTNIILFDIVCIVHVENVELFNPDNL